MGDCVFEEMSIGERDGNAGFFFAGIMKIGCIDSNFHDIVSRRPARFLVLGSASPDLLRQSSETLAGRIAYYELPGFSLSELTESKADILWLRGGFPRSFTARSHKQSYEWRGEFIRTFLERDVPQLGITIPSPTLDRFWSMLAHYHAQVWNGSELARAFSRFRTSSSGRRFWCTSIRDETIWHPHHSCAG